MKLSRSILSAFRSERTTIHQYHLIRLLRNSKLPECWERTDHFLSLSTDKNMNCSRMDDALCSLQIRIRGWGGLYTFSQLQSGLPMSPAQWDIIVGRLVTSRANRQLLRSAALSLDHIYLLLSTCPHPTYGDKLIPSLSPGLGSFCRYKTNINIDKRIKSLNCFKINSRGFSEESECARRRPNHWYSKSVRKREVILLWPVVLTLFL